MKCELLCAGCPNREIIEAHAKALEAEARAFMDRNADVTRASEGEIRCPEGPKVKYGYEEDSLRTLPEGLVHCLAEIESRDLFQFKDNPSRLWDFQGLGELMSKAYPLDVIDGFDRRLIKDGETISRQSRP